MKKMSKTTKLLASSVGVILVLGLLVKLGGNKITGMFHVVGEYTFESWPIFILAGLIAIFVLISALEKIRK